MKKSYYYGHEYYKNNYDRFGLGWNNWDYYRHLGYSRDDNSRFKHGRQIRYGLRPLTMSVVVFFGGVILSSIGGLIGIPRYMWPVLIVLGAICCILTIIDTITVQYYFHYSFDYSFFIQITVWDSFVLY